MNNLFKIFNIIKAIKNSNDFFNAPSFPKIFEKNLSASAVVPSLSTGNPLHTLNAKSNRDNLINKAATIICHPIKYTRGKQHRKKIILPSLCHRLIRLNRSGPILVPTDFSR